MYEMVSTALAAAVLSNSAVVASAQPTTCTVANRPAFIVRSVDVQLPPLARIENLTERR